MTQTANRVLQSFCRHVRRAGRVGLVGLVLAVLLGATLVLLSGRSLSAPEWLRDRIAGRIAQEMPGLDLAFGDMALLVRKDALVRVRLGDVDILDTRGTVVAEMAALEAAFAPLPLLWGEPKLRQGRIEGAMLTVRRAPDGALQLALGDAFAPGGVMPGLPAILSAVDAAFADPRLADLRAVEADGLILRYEDTRARRGWTADGGRLRVARENGHLQMSGDVAVIGGGAGAATLSLNAQSPLGDTSLTFGMTLADLPAQDIASQSPGLAWLDALRAPISGALRGSLGADGALRALNATLQIGAGALQPTLATRALPFDSARTYFTYDPDTALLGFDDIRVESPLGRFEAHATAQLGRTQGGWPETVAVQMSLAALRIAEGAVFDRSVALSGAEAAFQIALDPFRVTLGALTVADDSLPVTVSGRLAAGTDGWRLALDAGSEKVSLDTVLDWWPETQASGARRWLSENMRGATLYGATVALRSESGQPVTLYVDSRVSAKSVRLGPALPPLTAAEGHLVIHNNRLGLRLTAAQMVPAQGGALALRGSELVIPDMRDKPSRAEIALQGTGALTAVLSVIDNPEWRVLSKTGRDAGLATGQARFSGTLAFPVRKGVRFGDVYLALSGEVRDVTSEALVPGRRLRAEVLSVALSGDGIDVSGPLALDGVAATATWRQPLGKAPGHGRVEASVTVDAEALETFGVALPRGAVTGRGVAQLVLDLPPGQPPEMVLTSDLVGIDLRIPPLGWRKPAQAAGQLRVEAQLRQPMQVDRVALSAPGLQAEGSVQLAGSGQLDSVTLTRLIAGDWLSATGRLVSRGAGLPPRIEIASGRLDLRRRPAATAGAPPGAPTPLSVELNELVVTDKIRLTGLSGEFQQAQGLTGRFAARVGGRVPITGETQGGPNGTSLRVQARDAGDLLNAAQIGVRLLDGPVTLALDPVPGQTGSYDGRLQISETRLRNMPAIGALLDGISLVGILDQMNGPGIYFSDVDADFRLSNDQVVLRRGSAVGPSMGISLDGYLDLARGRLDLQGVLSPIYFLNGIGQLVSRRGEGLIGFNFTLRGPMGDPQVGVNPLSAFTPGMFRDIFRRPPPRTSR